MPGFIGIASGGFAIVAGARNLERSAVYQSFDENITQYLSPLGKGRFKIPGGTLRPQIRFMSVAYVLSSTMLGLYYVALTDVQTLDIILERGRF